jgi:hypothetical protein
MSGSSRLPGEACDLWFLPDAHGAEAGVVAEVEVQMALSEPSSASTAQPRPLTSSPSSVPCQLNSTLPRRADIQDEWLGAASASLLD